MLNSSLKKLKKEDFAFVCDLVGVSKLGSKSDLKDKDYEKVKDAFKSILGSKFDDTKGLDPALDSVLKIKIATILKQLSPVEA